MKNEMTKISVVTIAWYKEAEMYPELLDSLLNQSINKKFYEMIIVDDESDKATQAAVKPYLEKYPDMISLYKVKRNLRGVKRNLGASKAKSDLVLFLDGDMLAHRDLLAEHIEAHKKYKGSVLGFFNNVYKGEGKKGRIDRIFLDYISKTSDQNLFIGRTGDTLDFRFFYTGNVSVRKEAFQKAGGFDENFNQYGVEDLDLGYRLEIDNERFYFNKNAKSIHRYSPTFKDFCVKRRDAGKSLAYFTQKYRHLYTYYPVTLRETIVLFLRKTFFWSLSWISASLCEKYIEAAIRYSLFAGFIEERSKTYLKTINSEGTLLK